MPDYLTLQLRALMRNKRCLFFTVAFPLVFFLAVTTTISGSDEKTYAIGYMVSMAAYGAMAGVLNSTGPAIANERKSGWLRQLRLFPVSDGAIFGGKLLAAMATALPSLILLALAGRVVDGIELGAGTWVELVGLMWLGCLPFAGLGVLLGYVFEGETGRMVTILLGTLLAFLGGLWFPIEAMKGGFRNVATAMPSYRIYELGHNAVIHHAVNLTGVGIIAIYTAAFGLLAVLRIRQAGGLTG